VLLKIHDEIIEVAEGKSDKTDNVLKNAPHTADAIAVEKWNHNYSREKAVFPLAWIRENKFWPLVRRVDDAFGDRNLVCSCEPIETYRRELKD
jgi:glycine dehydrogenase